jgi:hypothetical protein
LKDGGVSKDEVDDVVLVGGSTRIPMVKELLSKYFDGKEPNTGKAIALPLCHYPLPLPFAAATGAGGVVPPRVFVTVVLRVVLFPNIYAQS